MNKGYTTLTLKSETLDKLKSLELNFHGLVITSNNDKIEALIKVYEDCKEQISK